MTHPFDLPGPHFLVFYSLLLAVSAGTVYLLWRSLGNQDAFHRPITDPYQIAYLRGGAKEAVKIAAASLAHRGLLRVEKDTLTSEPGESALAAHQLERSILEECIAGSTFRRIASGQSAETAVTLFHDTLVSANLILSNRQRLAVSLLKIATVIALVAVASFKMYVASQRGRHNVLLLFMLAVGGVIAHLKYRLWYTPNGKTVLNDLKIFFERLQPQLGAGAHGGGTAQLTFLMAVFGVASLSSTQYPFLSAFTRQGSSNSGCSSSCGDSSDSGSGCGGGDGGGGCGGCGN